MDGQQLKLYAYLSLSICRDERLEREPYLSVGQSQAAFKARRIGDEMHGRNTTKEIKGLTLEADMRSNWCIIQ